MAYKFTDLVDLSRFRTIMSNFYEATGIPFGFYDMKFNDYAAVSQQTICRQFHQSDPRTFARCNQSNEDINAHLFDGPFTGHKCLNGLIDYAAPIVIEGQHLANVFLGQILHEAPDEEAFRRQARQYGFDEEAYIAALRKVPIIPKERVASVMAFFTNLVQGLAAEGLEHLRRKEKEEALAKSERELRGIIEQSADGIILVDENGIITEWNHGEEIITGMPHSEALGKYLWDVFYHFTVTERRSTQAYEKYKSTILDVLAGKPAPWLKQLREDEINCADGQQRTIQEMTFSVTTEKGTMICTISRDITERKRLQEMMVANEKWIGLGTLVAGIAHEINSPLQVITGTSESLIKRLDQYIAEQEALRKKLSDIHRNSWRVAAIVRALSAYAQISPAEFVPQDLNAVVRDTLLIVNQLEGWTNFSIRTDLAPNLPPLPCNRHQISQALINLLTNARDAMPQGGQITISTAYLPELRYLQIQVIDTGEGIPETIRSKIFDPFFTTKPVGQGSGLGLSIVTGIVRSHQGEIEVDSQAGRGSTFTLSFPLERHVEDTAVNQPALGRFDER